ncbi:hypothetical protein PTI98_009077 [Pleurotus ostreatus]|uniref:Chromo domain-containing protein n=1 Tax=Pleurotus ostreatus (strain PC15) TaxID=1137138 RepID=A0A067NWS8_PLEO1|nr:hypothetical protein PTI98_009077 [Pleurotus ostreatus]KDQ32329.1 hypothetical protein PLEOSDRAFT_1088243 [Pleurotus ostreatus PC15]
MKARKSKKLAASPDQEYVVDKIIGAMLCGPLEKSDDTQTLVFWSKWIYYVQWQECSKENYTWEPIGSFEARNKKEDDSFFIQDFWQAIKSSGHAKVGEKVWLNEEEKDPASDGLREQKGAGSTPEPGGSSKKAKRRKLNEEEKDPTSDGLREQKGARSTPEPGGSSKKAKRRKPGPGRDSSDCITVYKNQAAPLPKRP